MFKFLVGLGFFLCTYGFVSAQNNIVYPKNNQILSETNIAFLWDENPTADFYQIQIATDS